MWGVLVRWGGRRRGADGADAPRSQRSKFSPLLAWHVLQAKGRSSRTKMAGMVKAEPLSQKSMAKAASSAPWPQILAAVTVASIAVWLGVFAFSPGASRPRRSSEEEIKAAVQQCAEDAVIHLQNRPVFVSPGFLSADEVSKVIRGSSSLASVKARTNPGQRDLQVAEPDPEVEGGRPAPTVESAGEGRLDVHARNAEVVDITSMLMRPDEHPPMPRALSGAVSRVRLLQHELQMRSAVNGFLEISLLRYPIGGFYVPHVDASNDTAADQTPASSRRKYSYVLFLTEPDWRGADGGQLRFHGLQPSDFTIAGGVKRKEAGLKGAAGSAWVDVRPTSGTLVIFDSTREHEVRVTRRKRQAIVGWFHRDVGGERGAARAAAGGRPGGASDEPGKAKKKKKKKRSATPSGA